MNRSRLVSTILLSVGFVAVVGGVFLATGLAAALIVGGCGLIAADFLVPSR